MTLPVTDSTFAREVLMHPDYVVVDVWAAWCYPSKAIAVTVDRLHAEQGFRLRVRRLNVDENVETVTKYGLRNLPAVLIFNGGRLVQRLEGAGTKELERVLLDVGACRDEDAPTLQERRRARKGQS